MSQPAIHTLLQRHSGRTLLVTDHGHYTYGDICRYALQFATWLREQDIEKGDCIAIIAGNSAAYVAAWFGAAMNGTIAATLNNQLIADSLRYTITQSTCKLIVADQDWFDRAYHHLEPEQQALPLIVFSDEIDFFQQLSSRAVAEPANVDAAEPSTILYTSGTTGLPKGVVNCHAAYYESGAAAASLLGLTPSDRLMVFLPLFHVNPQMMGFMSALAVGASVALRPRFSATAFFSDAKRFGATGCTFVGTIFSILASRYPGEERDHSMRFCFGAGAHGDVAKAITERFGMSVHEVYGMTELGGWTTGSPANELRPGSCGKPRSDIELIVVDKDDNPLPPGEKGEIVGRPRKPNRILLGYWNQPEKMIEACSNLWFHSGDMGSYDQDGYLYYHGRLKELIRRGGEMVSPIEIETKLMLMDGIADCAIVGVPDPIMDEEIKMVVVPEGDINPQEIVGYLRGFFPSYMIPRYLEFAKEIPKTSNQKVQRFKLRDPSPGMIDFRSS